MKCEFTYDPKLCTGVVGGSLRPLDATFKPIPATEFLQLWLDDVNNQIILFGMSENFLVEAVDGLNEVGPQLIPWSESTHLYFYTDDSCSVPLPDPQCITAHNPASAQQYADRVKYSGDQSLGPWPCQVTQPNGAKFIMKSFKIKSATKESLCRRVIVKMN